MRLVAADPWIALHALAGAAIGGALSWLLLFRWTP
jgi:hypothetical protein